MTEIPLAGPHLATHGFTLKYRSPLLHFFPFPLLSSPPPKNHFPAMLSTFPATFPATFSAADAFLGNPFEPGFPPWETHEPPFLFPEEPAVFTPQFSHEPVTSNSGSRAHNPAPSSGSDESNRNEPKITLSSGSGSGSGSDEPGRGNLNKKRPGCDVNNSVDDRKRRRMMSNRESARRSRMRKQKHLENLRNQANRLKLGNREQANRLRLILGQTQLFRGENERLRHEVAVLRQRLWDIRQVLVVRQLQQIMNPNLMQMPMQNNHHPTL